MVCQRVSCKPPDNIIQHSNIINLGLTFSFMTVPSFREHTLSLAVTEPNPTERRGPVRY